MAAEDPQNPTDSNRMNPFGPGANADETRQAQHQVANDAPVDVNANAVVARAQAETLTLMGKNFEAGAARRNGILDALIPTNIKQGI